VVFTLGIDGIDINARKRMSVFKMIKDKIVMIMHILNVFISLKSTLGIAYKIMG
jgi:hypothetical protein